MATSSTLHLSCHPSTPGVYPQYSYAVYSLNNVLSSQTEPQIHGNVLVCMCAHRYTPARLRMSHLNTIRSQCVTLIPLQKPTDPVTPRRQQAGTPIQHAMWAFVCHSPTITACSQPLCIYLFIYFIGIAHEGFKST